MDNLKTATNSLLKKLKESAPSDAPSSPTKQTEPETHECANCKDVGWFYREESGGKAIRCPCKAAEDQARRHQVLLRIDGLTTAERQKRFDQLLNEYEDRQLIDHMQDVALAGKGLLTLHGAFGVGKTTLLICAVNAGRENGKLSIYTTMSDLLSYLRSTFGPESDDTFDNYWDALIKADILALDELDEFNATSWAVERFLRLIDERWRRMEEVLTLCATNVRLNALPGKVRSRLTDGRAEIIDVGGKDMRGANEW